jgi:hypothetical protein
MAQPPERDGVIILLSSQGKYLIVEYSTTGTDHTGKQCRDWHAANLASRKHECIESGGKYLLKIRCDISFQADTGGSRSVATKTREDAIQLAGYFFRLNPKIHENGQSHSWSWQVNFEEEYEYSKWRRAMRNIEMFAMRSAER